MSENPSPSAYESYQHQKEVARHRRRAMGADMTLDDAEVRHDAIWNYVSAARLWVPYLASVLLGGIADDPVEGLVVCIASTLATMAVGIITGGMLDKMLGKFQPAILLQTQHLCLQIGGALMLFGGLGSQLPGVALTGVVMVATPILWKPFAQKVMGATDYAKLIQAQRQTTPPQLIE